MALSPARPFARFIFAALAGVVAAGFAYLFLGGQLGAAAQRQGTLPGLAPDEPLVAQSSFAQRIARGKVAIGLPVAGQEALLSELRVGDLLDVLAVVTGQNPASGTVLQGAIVLREAGRSGGELLLEVTQEESLAMAHLIARGARLTYALHPRSSVSSLP